MSDGPQRPRYPEYPGEVGPQDGVEWPAPARPAPQAAPAAWTPEQPQQSPEPAPPNPSWPTPPPAQARGPQGTPAGWWVRVGATLVDGVLAAALAAVPVVTGFVLAFADATFDEVTGEVSGVDPVGVLVAIAGCGVFLLFDVWNRGLRVGYKGQSLGKQLAGIRVVGNGGALLGPLEGFFRWFVAFLIQWTFVGTFLDLLWPLWDERKQTIHDKAIGSHPLVDR